VLTGYGSYLTVPRYSIRPPAHKRTVPIIAPLDIAVRAAPLVLAVGLLAAVDRLADGGPVYLALAVLLVFGALAATGLRRSR